MYKDIVSIHGVPRSGTTWLGQIFNSHENVRYKFQPLFSYTFKDALNVRSTKEEIEEFYGKLYQTESEFLDQKKQIENGIAPYFSNRYDNPNVLVTKMVRYHYLIPTLLNELDNFKVVGIIRHPLAVLSSWRNAPKEFFPHLNFNEEWRYAQNRNFFKPEEYFGFEKWKEFTKLMLWAKENYPDRVKIIRYEDLVNNTNEEIEELFNFTDLDVGNQTNTFIQQSTDQSVNDTYSVFKGNINLSKWEDTIPENISTAVHNELMNTEFERFIK